MKPARRRAASLPGHRTIMIVTAVVCVIAAGGAWSRESRSSGSDTVAVIGPRVITSDRFARLFRERVLRHGVSDNGETRLGYLRNLVDDEVLIARARAAGLDRTPGARKEWERVRIQELLNAYADRHVVANVEVTEGDLLDLFRKMNTRVSVRHLYAPQREGADSLYAELSRGRTFEDLARQVFADPRLRDHGGSLGYIGFDEMDPAFERVAFSLRPGEFSPPVKTVEGYSIIAVDDIQRNPFVTESEFARAHERLRGFVRKQKVDEAAARHVAGLRSMLGVRFDVPVLARVIAWMRAEPADLTVEQGTRSMSAGEMSRRVVESALGPWSVRDALAALGAMPARQRKWIRTRENLEDALAGLIVRGYMVAEAKKERLDAAPSYEARVAEAFDSFLLTSMEQRLREAIRISPDSVESYYRANRERFRTEPERRLCGILLDHAGASDSVRQLLQSGAGFEEVAARWSVQSATAGRGGDMGYFTRDKLGSFGERLFALPPGVWTGPLIQEEKYLFVKCTGVRESQARSLEESSKEIQAMLETLAWQKERSRFVDAAKKSLRCRLSPARVMTISFNH